MSLWLDTLSKDHALSFLATHLKKGNLMIGAAREEMESGKLILRNMRSKEQKKMFESQLLEL